jgi:hypothetical protein
MGLSRLDHVDKDIVRGCLVAVLDGPWIGDWEFQTRLGIDRDALRELLAAWPVLDDTTEGSPAHLAINNCMNEVCHGVPIAAEEWPRWFKASPDEVRPTYRKMGEGCGYSHTGLR